MYISPIDILDISLEALENIDQKSIILLEKRLKVLRLQDQDEFYNLEEMHTLLEVLKDHEKRKSIIFIEKHPIFKEFISSGNDNGPSTFFFEEETISQLSDHTDFLAPYLDFYFFPLLKQDYQARKYDTILEALQYEDLFSNDLLLRCYKYLEQQTIILIETIKVTKAKTLYEKCPQVTYDTHIELLNLIPHGIADDLKLEYVNALVDYYNVSRINNKEYNSIKKAYRLFAKIKTSDSFLEDQFKDLASLGYQDNGRDDNSASNNFEVIKVLAFLIAVFVGIARYAKNNSASDYSFDTIDTSNKEIFFENLTKTYQKNQKDFIWDLYQKSKDSSLLHSDEIEILQIKTGKSAFTSRFDFYYHNINKKENLSDSKTTDYITIKNKSNKSLILFTKQKSKPLMKSVFINSKDSLLIKYEPYTQLIYYLGTDFSRITKNDSSKKYFARISSKDNELLLQSNVIYEKKKGSSTIIIANDTIIYHNIKVKTTSNPDYKAKKKYDPFTSEITSNGKVILYDNYKRSAGWKKSKKSFFKQLRKNITHSVTQKIPDTFATGYNPYPNYFRNYSHVDVSGYPLLIKNNSKKHMVFFNRNLALNKDFAAYISPHEELQVFVHNSGDSLYFYRGDYFYDYKGLPILKSESKDINFFRDPIIIKEVKGSLPFVEILDERVKIIGLSH